MEGTAEVRCLQSRGWIDSSNLSIAVDEAQGLIVCHFRRVIHGTFDHLDGLLYLLLAAMLGSEPKIAMNELLCVADFFNY